MLRIKSPRLGLARPVVIVTTIFAFVLLPVLMTNASAHQDSHGANGHVPHEAGAYETAGHTADHADSDAHSDEVLPLANVDVPSDNDCEHVGDKCCSSFCSSVMISSIPDGLSKTYSDDYAARPVKALVSGEWVVPHRPPNT